MRTVALVAALAALVCAGVATAAVQQRSGLRDARYCEVLELKGAPPNGLVTVWNTIGLNNCPPARWNALDAAALAKELGDTAVVLNGPRHFLMDSAAGEVGATRSFHGLRARKVATIAIRTAADLVQTPYTDRTITRNNTWTWNRGRTVFELVAPGGDTYVMQSYAQIKDRTLTLAKLPALGRRLKPPEGWRYRTRRLTRDLTLSARGGATIVQDELQNTYQLATTTHRGRPRARYLSLSGRTRTVGSSAPGTVEDRGTVTGTPFGNGTVVLNGTFADGRLNATFRLTFPDGSVTGTASLPFTIIGGEIDFTGTGRLTAGTGAFRGVSSSTLQIHDHNTLDGQNGTLAVTGGVVY